MLHNNVFQKGSLKTKKFFFYPTVGIEPLTSNLGESVYFQMYKDFELSIKYCMFINPSQYCQKCFYELQIACFKYF